MTSVNVTSVTNTVTVVEGDTTVVTVTTAGPQGATGTVAAANSGTAAAPGISFASDPNTGIYNPSADNLSFSTGGVQRLSIASDGTINVVGNLTEGGNNVVSVGDTGTVTSTMILDGTILNEDINASAAIVDTKLATISTAGKVSNSATTATSANTASAIVARDGSGNFSAGIITAALTGAASSNVLKAGDTMTGPLLVPAGTAALPGLAVSGDANTGIYSLGADQVAISTGGTGRLFVDASGRVGIGTSAPGLPLDVVGTIRSSTTVTAGSDFRLNNDSFSRIAHSNGSGGFVGGYNVKFATGVKHDSTGNISAVYYDNNGVLRFYTNTSQAADTAGQERLTITAAGNVGIGTSAPGSTLEVNGTLTTQGNIFASSGGATRTITLGSTGAGLEYNVDGTTYLGGRTDAYPLVLRTNSSERLRITAAGNVGIGTSSPGSALEINAAASTSPFIAKINTAEAARIDSSGRLLVGTSVSNSRFYNTTSVAHYFQQEVATTTAPYMASWTVNSGAGGAGVGPHLSLARSRGASNSTYTIVQSGDSLGHISFQGADGGELVEAARIEAAVDGTPGSNDMPGRLVFYTTADGAASPTERMRINSAGRVGIATTTCTAQLEIGGSVALGTTRAAYLRYPGDSANPARTTFEITANESGTEKAAFRIMGDGSIQGNTYAGVVVRNSAGTEIARFQDAGLKFPATQVASADPNTLDDYEEGTWTPNIANFTVSGTTTSTGTYTKIGRIVYFDVTFANTGTIAYATDCLITLPFAGISNSGMVAMSLNSKTESQTSGKNGVQIFIDGIGRFFVGSFTTTSAGQQLNFSGFYRVS